MFQILDKKRSGAGRRQQDQGAERTGDDGSTAHGLSPFAGTKTLDTARSMSAAVTPPPSWMVFHNPTIGYFRLDQTCLVHGYAPDAKSTILQQFFHKSLGQR
jgi:hypothetical protein